MLAYRISGSIVAAFIVFAFASAPAAAAKMSYEQAFAKCKQELDATGVFGVNTDAKARSSAGGSMHEEIRIPTQEGRDVVRRKPRASTPDPVGPRRIHNVPQVAQRRRIRCLHAGDHALSEARDQPVCPMPTARARIIGDYRRVALYGADEVHEAKKAERAQVDDMWRTDDVIRDAQGAGRAAPRALRTSHRWRSSQS